MKQIFNPHHDHLFGIGSLNECGVDLKKSQIENKTSYIGRYRILKKDECSKFIIFNFMDKEFFKIPTNIFFKNRNVNISTNVTINTIRKNHEYSRISQVEYYNLILNEFNSLSFDETNFINSFYAQCEQYQQI